MWNVDAHDCIHPRDVNVDKSEFMIFFYSSLLDRTHVELIFSRAPITKKKQEGIVIIKEYHRH